MNIKKEKIRVLWSLYFSFFLALFVLFFSQKQPYSGRLIIGRPSARGSHHNLHLNTNSNRNSNINARTQERILVEAAVATRAGLHERPSRPSSNIAFHSSRSSSGQVGKVLASCNVHNNANAKSSSSSPCVAFVGSPGLSSSSSKRAVYSASSERSSRTEAVEAMRSRGNSNVNSSSYSSIKYKDSSAKLGENSSGNKKLFHVIPTYASGTLRSDSDIDD